MNSSTRCVSFPGSPSETPLHDPHIHSIPSSYSYYNTTFSHYSLKHSPSAPLSRLRSVAPVLSSSYSSNSPPSSRRRLRFSSLSSSNSLVVRMRPVSLGLGG